MKKPDLVRQKAPVYSLAGRSVTHNSIFPCYNHPLRRFGVPSDKASLPGPGAYVPEKVHLVHAAIFLDVRYLQVNPPSGEHTVKPAPLQLWHETLSLRICRKVSKCGSLCSISCSVSDHTKSPFAGTERMSTDPRRVTSSSVFLHTDS